MNISLFKRLNPSKKHTCSINLFLLLMYVFYGLPIQAGFLFALNQPSLQAAAIVMEQGVPVLKINGESRPPLIFFFNTETGIGQDFLAPQVEMAAHAGVHIYSMPFDAKPWSYGDETIGPEDYGETDALLDRFLAVDPNALFIPRIRSTPPWNWSGWDDVPDSERISYQADGISNHISAASDLLWQAFATNIVRFIERYENSPYGKHILGYHIGGQSGSEWFQFDYRTKGPDYSEANERRFREWLHQHYGDDAAISTAWGREMSLNDARIPTSDPNRLRISPVPDGVIMRAFYAPPGEQAWIDYSRYFSDLIAERITHAAALIKEATDDRKLAVFFYGYVNELPGSYGGHYAMQTVLADENVDVLVSPLSYSNRMTGGPSGSMTAVDSVAANGKLWLNEDDMRTHLIDEDDLPPWLGRKDETFTSDLYETRQLLLRNMGLARIHRTGTWWMDLFPAGAFLDASLWDGVMGDVGLSAFDELYEMPEPYRPEVAMIIDERSQTRLYSQWDVWRWTLQHCRDSLLKSGASVGFYYLNDLLAGKVPECKVYLFANAFELHEAEVDALLALLREQSATALWQYAPGYFTATGHDPTQMQRLTGLSLTQVDGRLGVRGVGAYDGIDWGWTRDNTASPRFVIEDAGDDMEVLGHYRDDDAIAAARIHHDGFDSIFSGDIALNTTVLRAIFRSAGVHLWVEDDSVVHSDGRILVIHTVDAGSKKIALPAGKKLYTWDGDLLSGPRDEEVTVSFTAGETRWFSRTGDFVCDAGVELADFLHFVAYWLETDCECWYNCGWADINADGVVNFKDFSVMAENWLVTAP